MIMTMKKGNILLQVVIALLIMSTIIFMVFISSTLGGSDVKDFFSGVLVGLSIGEMLTGVYIVAKSMAKEKKIDEMSKYWNNLERFKIYLPIEKPLDIVY